MIAEERLAAIAVRLARIERRCDVADVPWLVHVCGDLLDEVARLRPVQARLQLDGAA